MKRISLEELKKKIDSREDFLLLDVRTPQEYEAYHIPQAVKNIDHEKVWTRHEELPKDKEIVVVCRTGNRTLYAANALEQIGFKNITVAPDGTSGWNEFLLEKGLISRKEYEENKQKIRYQVIANADGSKRII